MKDSKEVLTSVLHTVQMGQMGIKSVMNNAIRPGLQQELRSQLAEYDAIETQAQQLATANGWVLPNVNPALLKMADMMSRARLMGGDVDSKIAGMLIQGNTRGMILGLKNLHRAGKADPAVKDIAQKLLDRENINIQKTQPYL